MPLPECAFVCVMAFWGMELAMMQRFLNTRSTLSGYRNAGTSLQMPNRDVERSRVSTLPVAQNSDLLRR